MAEYRDDGVSASRYARGKVRPGWQQVLDDLAAGRADALCVWEVSRGTRDRAVWAALVAGLIEARAVLVVDGKVHDPADPDDGFALDLSAALGVREVAMLSKRVRRGVASRAATGAPHAKVPFGVRAVHDTESGRVVRYELHEEEAAVVRDAAARILAGETPTSIARELIRNGVRSPGDGRWTGTNLLRLVSSPASAGLRVHRGEVLDGVRAAWPPIVSMEQHRELQQIAHDPRRRTERNGAHAKHLLSGVAHCDVCGGPLGTLTRRRPSGPVVTYRCRLRFCVSRRADELDEYVEAVVIGRLLRPDLAVTLAAQADDPAVRRAGEEVARLRAKLEEARRLVDEDRLSLDSLADLEARTLPRLRMAEQRAQPRHLPAAVLDVAGADAAARWERTPVGQRRQIVRALMDVRVGKAPARGPNDEPDYDSVRITWRT